jgi:hypothetical protein
METFDLFAIAVTVYNLIRKSIGLLLGTAWPLKHKTQIEDKTLEAASKQQLVAELYPGFTFGILSLRGPG